MLFLGGIGRIDPSLVKPDMPGHDHCSVCRNY
jgi:hypothetical protein